MAGKGTTQQKKLDDETEYKLGQIRNTALQSELEKLSRLFQRRGEQTVFLTKEDYLMAVGRLLKKYHVTDDEARQYLSRASFEELKPL